MTLTGWLLLVLLAWAAPSPAQDPPPLDTFTLDAPQPSGQVHGGDANLTDFFLEAAENADLQMPAAPPLPPSAPESPSAAAGSQAPMPAAPDAAQHQAAVPPPVVGQAPAEMDYFDLSDDLAGPVPLMPPASDPAVSSSAPPAVPPAPDQTAARPAPPTPGTGYLNFDDLMTPTVTPPAAPPTPASSPAAAAAAPDLESVPSPFLDPPPADQAPIHADSPPLPPPQVGSVSVPLGQGALPAPQWATATESSLNPSQFVSGTAMPQFDSGQGQWLQLEVGQADAGLRPAVAKPAARPTSVSTVSDTAASPPLPPAGAAPTPAAAGSASVVDAAMDQALAPTPAGRPLEPAEREKLRHLFSDMLPPDSLGARAPVTAQPPAGQTVPGPAKAPSSSPEPAAQPAGEDEGSSAILKAGGLLTLDGQAGAAQILPPGAPAAGYGQAAAPPPPPPAKAAVPPLKTGQTQAGPGAKPPPAKSVPTEDRILKPAATAAQPAPVRKNGSGGSRKKKAAASSPAPVVKAGLIIVNETGQSQVGETYRSVLSKMGYTIVSVANKPTRGRSAGQTVINYRSGYFGQAQSVARHLPGKKVLVEARGDQVLASEIMINLK